MLANSIQSVLKSFYLIDDRSDNFFEGVIHRKDEELIDEMKSLKIGEYYHLGNGKSYMRSHDVSL